MINDFDEQRIIQRATVMGDQPQAAEPPRWAPYSRSVPAGASSRYDRELNKFFDRNALLLESNRKLEE